MERRRLFSYDLRSTTKVVSTEKANATLQVRIARRADKTHLTRAGKWSILAVDVVVELPEKCVASLNLLQ